MFARKSLLTLGGAVVARTPLLVPSFSSKGFPEVEKILTFSKEFITDVTLVSAYDIHYELVTSPINFVDLAFLDSGGFEASQDYEFAEMYKRDHFPREWTIERYTETVSTWRPGSAGVVVSFDHPKQFLKVEEQIAQAKAMKEIRGDVLWEILLKPETEDQRFVPIDKVLDAIHQLAGFDLIGFAERELGSSYRKRAQRVAELRRALDEAGITSPIHLFGSLDPVTSPLYFLAGAEVFDGLTWLRLAFKDGRALHVSTAAAELDHATQRTETDLFHSIWSGNLYYLSSLRSRMLSALEEDDPNALGHHYAFYETEMQALAAHMGEH